MKDKKSLFPRISIITPSYNDDKFLELTILSVLSQGYPNLEYVIIDGGSTDGSIDIIKKYEKQIYYWESNKDKGMYYALEKGFKIVTGEVMGWINSDDILQTGSLFTIGQIFNDCKKIDWLQGTPNAIDEINRIIYVSPAKGLDKYSFYKKEHAKSRNYIPQESTFWRRSLWDKAGGYISTKYELAGDFELWMRFFQYEKIYKISALLGSFRVSKYGQASFDRYDKYVEETYSILKRYPLTKKEIRQVYFDTLTGKIKKMLKSLICHILPMHITKTDTVYENSLFFNKQHQKFE